MTQARSTENRNTGRPLAAAMLWLFVATTATAQDPPDDLNDADDPGPPAATTKASPDAEESGEAAARLREAINENLIPERPGEAARADEEDEAIESPEVPAAPRKPLDEEEPPAEEWYDKFTDQADRLQRLPEKIPFLAGKDWLHFGRIEFEAARFNSGVLEDDSGFNFRSLRGGLIRQVNESLLVKLELDLTDGDSNFTDLYGRYNTRIGMFTLGNQKIAQTLVNQTSRLSRTFMEEALPADAFGLGRRLGVGWDFRLPRVGAHLTAFGPDLNDNIGKFGYGLRVHGNPTLSKLNMVHLGASAVQEQMDRDAQFRAYPESRVTDIRLVDTGRVEDVDTQSIFGFELAAARKSTSFRSEVFRARWDLENSETRNFDGFYVQVNKALTGESFQYAQGKFLRLRPEHRLGAWEVGLRYSRVDLRDGDVQGGRQNNTSLALNWYAPGQQLRVMANLVYVDADTPDGGRETPWIFQLRAQVHW